MTMAASERTDFARSQHRMTGTLGLVITVSVAVILGVHPRGSTGLYDDGVRFTEHVGWFWIAIHFVGAFFFVGIPAAILRRAALTAPSAVLETSGPDRLGGGPEGLGITA
jgi:hypothetical protein